MRGVEGSFLLFIDLFCSILFDLLQSIIRSYMNYPKSFLFLIPFLLLSPKNAQGQTISIDENFSDWEAVPTFVNEEPDDAESGDIDFTGFKITNDDRFIYFYLEVDSEILLQQFHDITLLIDVDDDPETGQAFSGIGYELRYNLGQREGEVNLAGQTVINSYDIGLVSAPTVTSNRFEIKINRDAEINGTPIFNSDSIAILFRSQSAGGDLVPDSPSSHSYTFNHNSYSPTSYSLEKHDANDLRFMTYNVLRDNLFEAGLKENFERIFKAIQPDIIGLEEVYNHSGEEAANLMQEFLGGDWFHGDVGNDNLMVSRYPIIEETAIMGNAAYLLDINQFHIFVIVAHPPCCTNDDTRQEEIDAFMAFLRDSKSGNGFDLEEQTPIVIMGDMNLVGLNRQVKTLLEGDIQDEATYGEDFSPDWDGTPLEDSKPANPGLPTTFTWYNENSAFSAGRLDYIVYSGSVFELGNNFSLHTKTLPQDTLDSFSLERDDTFNASDHLPLIADFRLLPITSSHPVPDIPTQAILNQNFPNPFNPTTEISFALPNHGFVSLEVFDISGRKVATLINGIKSKGQHAARWNANSAASGIYIYRLTTAEQVITRKMVLIK